MLCAACSLMLVSVGTAQSDSSNFAGPYVGFQALGVGAEFKGQSNSSAGTSGAVEDQVPVGATVGTFGIEAGYVLPLGSTFALDVGGEYTHGETKIDHQTSGEDSNAGNVSMTVDKFYSWYVAPTIALSDTSSLYLKAGVSHADVGITGDVRHPGDLSGESWSIGTRTVLPSGIFIRTEAGVTEYNGISAHGKGAGVSGQDLIDSTTSYAAEPTIIQGTVSIGLRF